MNELGALLRKLRGKRSLREIAEISGVSHNYLSIVEKGVDPRTKTPVSPSPETLKKLSEAYRYDYEELMYVAGYIDKNKESSDDIIKESKELYDIQGFDDLLRDIDFSDEELLEKYNFLIGGKKINEEKVKKILDFIRFMAD